MIFPMRVFTWRPSLNMRFLGQKKSRMRYTRSQLFRLRQVKATETKSWGKSFSDNRDGARKRPHRRSNSFSSNSSLGASFQDRASLPDDDREEGNELSSSDSSDANLAVVTPALMALTFTACLGMVQFGYNTGVIAGALLYIEHSVQLGVLSTMQKSLIVSSVTFGAVLGTLCAGVSAAWAGRRVTLLGTCVVYTAGVAVAALSPGGGMWGLITGRLLTGLAVGASTSLTTMYIAECSPPSVRGRLCAWSPLAGTAGILMSYMAAMALGRMGLSGDMTWRAMLALGATPGILILILNRWLPESPRWLASQGRIAEARQVHTRLLGGVLEEEENGIEDGSARPLLSAVDREERQDEEDQQPQDDLKSTGWRGLLQSPESRRAALIGVTLNFFQQASGINVVVYFAPKILTQLGFGKEHSLLITTGIGIVQVISTFLLGRVVDRLGRVPLALWGLGGMCAGLGALMLSFQPPLQIYHHVAWLAVIGIFIYRICFSMSMGPLTYIITAEVFPTNVRSIGVGFSSAANWAANCVVSYTFLPLLAFAKPENVWGIYIAICLLAALFIVRVVPETKGKALQDK